MKRITNTLSFILFLSAALPANAALDMTKVKTIFPEAKIVSTKELRSNYFEVQMIEKNSIVKKTHFYTNNSVDFIATKFVFTTPDQKQKYGIEKPVFDYSDIKLSDFATFTHGEGEERNYFLTIPSDKSVKELKSIFAGNGYKNNVFLPFDTSNYLQLLYNLPIFSGSNENRIKEAKITLDAIDKINKDLLTEKQADELLASRLVRITKTSSKETLDKMAEEMQVATELKSIFVPDLDFAVIADNKKTIHKQNKPLSQTLEEYTFSNDELTDNWRKTIEDTTAYTIGSGPKKVFLFSDIDCPICVSLDQKLNTSLSSDYTIHVLYIPIQELHPNSLDKTRYIHSLPESERWGMSGAVQGTDLDAELPREFLADLDSKVIEAIDVKISKSIALSRVLQVTGTPTAFQLVTTGSGDKLQIINPQSLVLSNLN